MLSARGWDGDETVSPSQFSLFFVNCLAGKSHCHINSRLAFCGEQIDIFNVMQNDDTNNLQTFNQYIYIFLVVYMIEMEQIA